MASTTGKTLGALAAENPRAVRVFEKYKIDFCCGGDRPVEEACRQRGISIDELLAEIQAVARTKEERDWQRAPLSELTNYIIARHHGYLRKELPEISGMIEKVVAAHGLNHGDSLLPLRRTFADLAAELSTHMMKEERVLFPLIEQMEKAAGLGFAPPPVPGGSVNNPIRMMKHEHDDAAAALAQMRRLTSDYGVPDDGCATYRALFQRLEDLEADLHEHIHLENNVLFPRTAQLEQARRRETS
jgi:regulator of cell morphogenesis and NO signaling